MLAVVTGGDRGIGFAIAEKLVEHGYDIVIAAKDRKMLAEAKRRLAKSGKAYAFRCDVRDRKQIKRLVKDVGRIGSVDLFVNDAGVAYRKEVIENSDEEIDEMIDVNFRGLVDCTRAFLPGMLKRKKGTIINISSGAGKSGIPELAVYCGTKFAVIGFTEAIAGEVEGDGVRVYAICPGATDTDMWHRLYPGSPASYVPEDVAIEVMELLENVDRIEPGRAIDVRKHV